GEKLLAARPVIEELLQRTKGLHYDPKDALDRSLQNQLQDKLMFFMIGDARQHVEEQDFASFVSHMSHWKELDMVRHLQWDRDTQEEVVNNRFALRNGKAEMDSRPAAVILAAKEDKSGAFTDSLQAKIRELMDGGYRVLYFEVGNDRDIAAALQ